LATNNDTSIIDQLELKCRPLRDLFYTMDREPAYRERPKGILSQLNIPQMTQ